jgi:hypothetical protein
VKDFVRVDLRWSPERISHFCEKRASWVLSLAPRSSPRGIARLYRRHVKSAFCSHDVLIEIAADQRTPVPVLLDIWKRFRSDGELMSALACNPSASEAWLNTLARSPEGVVAEHARATLRRIRVGRGTRGRRRGLSGPHGAPTGG